MQTKIIDAILSPSRIERNQEFLKYLIERSGKKSKKFKNVESYMRFARRFLKYPKMTELDYYKAIMRKTEMLIKSVRENIVPKIPNYIATYKNEARLVDGAVNDQSRFLQEIERDFKVVASDMNVTFSNQSVNSLVINYADKVNKANAEGLNQLSASLIGIDLFKSESWLETVSDVWINNNVNLITSIPTEYLNRVEWIVKDSIQAGRTIDEIQSTILESVSFKPTERTIASKTGLRLINPIARSALIARDQVGKFFGQLSQYRQLDAGVIDFTWSAVMDERTRPHHAILDGKTFSWAKGANGLYPGMDYQCRCISYPVFPTFDF